MTDKDRPSSWVSFRADLCASCVGACCTMPLEVRRSDLTRLGLAVDEASDKRAFQRLRKEGIVRSYRAATGLFLLEQTSAGRCLFLEGSRCAVYDARPDTCRDFPQRVGPRVGFCPYQKQKP